MLSQKHNSLQKRSKSHSKAPKSSQNLTNAVKTIPNKRGIANATNNTINNMKKGPNSQKKTLKDSKHAKRSPYTSTLSHFSTSDLSDLSTLLQVEQQQDGEKNTSLTMEQRKIWYMNKMKPIVQKTIHHLLCQYQLTSPSTSQSPSEAAFNTLLDHELLVPISAQEHPYKHPNNKKELISEMITKALIPLDIVPPNYHLTHRIGTIPPIEFNGKNKTDTTDLRPLEGLNEEEIKNREKITTVADMIAMVLAASGFKDIPDTEAKWLNTQLPPAGEDHNSDFSGNLLKLFHPDDSGEFSSPIHRKIREELAIIQSDLAEATSLNVFDTYASNYERRDVTQLFLAHYAGGQFPNIEVYKSFLMQQAAQTMLNEQYLYGSFTPDEFKGPNSNAVMNPDGKTPVSTHYHTVAGSMEDFKKQSEKVIAAKKQQDIDVFINVQTAMPSSSYPALTLPIHDGKVTLPSPPEKFLMQGVAFRHTIKPFSVLDENAVYPFRDQFRPILYSPGHTISGLRELFLQHFRHDITTYYNFVENDVLQKFKNELEDEKFSPQDLTVIRTMVESLYAQNQLDNEFKEVYTNKELTRIKRIAEEDRNRVIANPNILNEATNTPEAGSINDNTSQSGPDGEELTYRHSLGESYPAFAQKCYQLLITDCDEHVDNIKNQLIERIRQEGTKNVEEKNVEEKKVEEI